MKAEGRRNNYQSPCVIGSEVGETRLSLFKRRIEMGQKILTTFTLLVFLALAIALLAFSTSDYSTLSHAVSQLALPM